MTHARIPKTVIIYRDSVGNESSQRRDIHQAQAYWQEYKSHD